jgi:hypothetical protein
MSGETAQKVTLEDHRKAFDEVAFLLDIFTATIDNIMGGATAPVGRIAGRDMAKKLPIALDNPSLEEALGILAERMKSGFEFTLESDGTEVAFGRCILRDVCALRNREMGEALCRLFHAYFDGIVNELVCRPVKSEIKACGETCRTTIRIQ